MINKNIPEDYYGVLQRNLTDSAIDVATEQIRDLGYAVINSGYTDLELQNISNEFNRTRKSYIKMFGESVLRSINEFYIIRSPLTHGGKEFINLALNKNLIRLIGSLIPGKFILNQQNGIINPPGETYSQAAWHRDLPYQHYTSSKPLAINALFCIDDFTNKNGASLVLPASHKAESFPSDSYVKRNAVQIEAKAGSYVVIDCMVFHTGGSNNTDSERRAVNHVYNIPYFKQQIRIPTNIKYDNLSEKTKDILGFNNTEPETIDSYFVSRKKKKKI